jgi:hypothetical protein
MIATVVLVSTAANARTFKINVFSNKTTAATVTTKIYRFVTDEAATFSFTFLISSSNKESGTPYYSAIQVSIDDEKPDNQHEETYSSISRFEESKITMDESLDFNHFFLQIKIAPKLRRV